MGLRYLYAQNVDLTAFCDNLKYGSPAFYIARHGRIDCLLVLLEDYSYDLEILPCTKFGEKVSVYIRKFNPLETAAEMIRLVEHGHLRHVMALKIQGRVRIMLARRRVHLIRNPDGGTEEGGFTVEDNEKGAIAIGTEQTEFSSGTE